jgi:hypothetical protein
MSDLLKRDAVSALKGKEAAEILQAYIGTEPEMSQSHTPSGTQKQPQGTGAGDKLIKPR